MAAGLPDLCSMSAAACRVVTSIHACRHLPRCVGADDEDLSTVGHFWPFGPQQDPDDRNRQVRGQGRQL